MVGEKVQGYRILEVLGSGAIGVVYVGEHEKMGRKAAVKLLRPELSSNAELMGRFFDEARAATLIRHPGVVQVFDCGALPSTGQAFIVMELLEGESLRNLLNRVPRLLITHAARVIHDLSDVLSAVHDRGIVHRDLKPDNVFLARDEQGKSPTVKVLDFGIAKLSAGLARSHQGTLEGSLLGTPAYMAPEQCRGATDADSRTDIYALGCIFFELLSGRPPFVGAAIGALVAAHLTEQPPDIRSLRPNTPDAVADLIARCLAKTPVARPTMLEIRAATELLIASTATQTFEVAPPELPPIVHSHSTEVMPPPITTLKGGVGVIVEQAARRRLHLGAVAAGGVAIGAAIFILWPSSRRHPSVEKASAASESPPLAVPVAKERPSGPVPAPAPAEPTAAAAGRATMEAGVQPSPEAIDKPARAAPATTPEKTEKTSRVPSPGQANVPPVPQHPQWSKTAIGKPMEPNTVTPDRLPSVAPTVTAPGMVESDTRTAHTI